MQGLLLFTIDRFLAVPRYCYSVSSSKAKLP